MRCSSSDHLKVEVETHKNFIHWLRDNVGFWLGGNWEQDDGGGGEVCWEPRPFFSLQEKNYSFSWN